MRKIQSYPPHIRKLIFWLVIIIAAAVMAFWWIKSAQQRFSSFRGEDFVRSFNLPRELGETELPKLKIENPETTADNILQKTESSPEEVPKVCFGSACFKVEIADTKEERNKGLSGRQSLGLGEAMLFVFDAPGIYKFWMRDMNFPLDIIWIGEDKKVVSMVVNAQPCEDSECPLFAPPAPVLYTLEVNGGTAEFIGIKTGDVAEIFINHN